MNEAVARILERYDCRSFQDHLLALREILQEIALLGLWRSKFFEKAAFYGGFHSLCAPMSSRIFLPGKCTRYSAGDGRIGQKAATGTTLFGMLLITLSFTWPTWNSGCGRAVTGKKTGR